MPPFQIHVLSENMINCSRNGVNRYFVTSWAIPIPFPMQKRAFLLDYDYSIHGGARFVSHRDMPQHRKIRNEPSRADLPGGQKR